MKIYMEKYDNNKTYMSPSGELMTPELVAKNYPATKVFVHLVQTDSAGQMMFSLLNFVATKDRYEIGAELSEEEAIKAITEAMEAERNAEPEPSAEERVAAALEYQNLLSL